MTIAAEKASGATEAESPPALREHRRFLFVVLGVVVVALWIVPLRSSLWLDETVTYWVVKDGFSQAIRRSLDYQGITPLYYAVDWVAKTILGRSEIALRIPSLLSMGLATFLLYRLGRRLFDADTGILAAIVFAASFGGAYAASDARPYGLALLAVIASTLALVRWLERGRVADAILYAVLAALVVYVHWLFAPVLLAHLVYALYRWRTGGAVGLSWLLIAGAGIALLLFPAFPQFLYTFGRRGTLNQPAYGTVPGLLITLAPLALVVGLLGGVLLAKALSPTTLERPALTADTTVLLLAWFLTPPLVLYAVSNLMHVGIFTPRYLLSSFPAPALLVGYGIRLVDPMKARRIVLTSVVIVSMLAIGTMDHTGDGGAVEDWRIASAKVNAVVTTEDTPVLLQSGLIESRQVDWLADPAKAGYLNAPAAAYRMEGRIVPMPFDLDPPERAYLEGVIDDVLLQSDRFLLIMRTKGTPESPLLTWLDARLAPVGYTARIVGNYGVILVVLFQRSGTA